MSRKYGEASMHTCLEDLFILARFLVQRKTPPFTIMGLTSINTRTSYSQLFLLQSLSVKHAVFKSLFPNSR